jgi:hypothetical protein
MVHMQQTRNSYTIRILDGNRQLERHRGKWYSLQKLGERMWTGYIRFSGKLLTFVINKVEDFLRQCSDYKL